MIKNKIIFSLSFVLFSSSYVFAGCGDLKEGEVRRLDRPGKSLENNRMQDQDGIGTCYANSASLMLRTALKNNPDVSYLDLAIQYADSLKVSTTSVDGQTEYIKNKDDIYKGPKAANSKMQRYYGGFGCDAILQAKKNGGVCLREDVFIENEIFDPNSGISNDMYSNSKKSSSQKILMLSVDKYLDQGFKLNNQSPEQFRILKEKLKSHILKNQNTMKNHRCNNFDDSRIKNVLIEVVVTAKAKLEQLEARNGKSLEGGRIAPLDLQTKIQRYNSLLSLFGRIVPNYKNGVKVIDLDFYNESNRGGHIDISELLSKKYSQNLRDKKYSNGMEALKDFILQADKNSKFFTKNNFLNNFLAELGPDIKTKMNKEFKQYSQRDMNSCDSKTQFEFQETISKDIIYDLYKDDDFVCHKDFLESFISVTSVLEASGLDKLSSFLDNVLDATGKDYEKAYLTLLAPGCSDENKVKIPESLTCEKKSPIPFDPKNEEKWLERVKDDYAKSISTSLNTGVAVGLDFCMGNIKDVKQDYFYQKNKKCIDQEHGHHAMTIIGQKCENNQMHYLLQNSWGEWKEGIMNEKIKSTYENRLIWLDEDEVAKNAETLNIITP